MARLTDDSILADRRVTEWQLRQRRLEETEGPARRQSEARQTWELNADRPPAVVTITHQTGMRGEEVAAALPALLGERWEVWDDRLIEAVAQDAHVRAKIVQGLDEHVSSGIEDFVRDLFGLRHMEPLGYQHHLARVLLSVAQQGEKIIVGRGGNFLLPNALHVRVQACMDTRVHNVMEERHIRRDGARRLIHMSDSERAAFILNIAHHRIDEDGAYDLMVWTDRLTPDAAAAPVAAAVRAMFPWSFPV